MTRTGYVCFFAAALCSFPQTYSDYMRQGAEAFNRGELNVSTRAYEEALRANPGDVLGKLHLAYVLLRQEDEAGSWERARKLSAEALQMSPGNNHAEWNLALLDGAARNSAGVKSHCAAILSREPQHAGCLFTAAIAAWSVAFPEVMAARQNAGMRPDSMGVLPDAAVRSRLREIFDADLVRGLEQLAALRQLHPRHADAAAYQNLILRLRAMLAPTEAEARTLVAEADGYVQQALAMRGANEAAPESRLDPARWPPMTELPKQMAPPPPPPPPPPAR